MKAWKFDTALQSQETAIASWQDVLGRLSLPSSNIIEPAGRLYGRVSCLVSPLGIELARLTGSAQEISGRYTRQPDGIWLAQLLDGEAILSSGDGPMPMSASDIAFGPVATHSALALGHDFSLLSVRLPWLALHPRLVGPAPLRVELFDST